MHRRIILCIFSFVLLLAACDEKESNIGVNLQDPSTFYDGIVDSAFCRAVTIRSDSLITSGLSSTPLGCYSNPDFGSSEASFFSQIITSDNSWGFDTNCHIDSVVLSLSISKLYPALSPGEVANLHFEVYQLQQAPEGDSVYYCFNSLPVGNVCFFDDVVSIRYGDTMIADMRLNDNFVSLIEDANLQSADDMVETLKGVRIRLLNDGSPVMATINLTASATRVTTHYRYITGGDTMARQYEFTIGHSAPHFSRFVNNYSGSLAAFMGGGADSLAGNRYLYLFPMGGTNVKLDFGSFVRQFSSQHPLAVIHHAELLLPVADISPSDHPSTVAAFRCNSDGTLSSVPDYYDPYTFSGYDGGYDSAGYYRIRITQHLQKLLRAGDDNGTVLALYEQLYDARRVVFNGFDTSATSGNAVRLRFVYSE